MVDSAEDDDTLSRTDLSNQMTSELLKRVSLHFIHNSNPYYERAPWATTSSRECFIATPKHDERNPNVPQEAIGDINGEQDSLLVVDLLTLKVKRDQRNKQ